MTLVSQFLVNFSLLYLNKQNTCNSSVNNKHQQSQLFINDVTFLGVGGVEDFLWIPLPRHNNVWRHLWITPISDFFVYLSHRWLKKCANHCDRNEVTFALSVRNTTASTQEESPRTGRNPIRDKISNFKASEFHTNTPFFLCEPFYKPSFSYYVYKNIIF